MARRQARRSCPMTSRDNRNIPARWNEFPGAAQRSGSGVQKIYRSRHAEPSVTEGFGSARDEKYLRNCVQMHRSRCGHSRPGHRGGLVDTICLPHETRRALLLSAFQHYSRSGSSIKHDCFQVASRKKLTGVVTKGRDILCSWQRFHS